VADALAPAARSVGADAEAERRAASVLEELEHLDLNVVVLPYPDEDVVRAVERARDAALAAGRRDLLEFATRGAREVAIRAFSRSGFSGTWAATEMGAYVVRADDRVAAAAAFEAAVTAAVAEDVIDAETAEILREPTDALRATTGLPPPGALSNFASTAGRGPTDAIQVGLGIAVGIAGVVVALAFGTVAIGLIVIAGGLALIGVIGRWRSAP
jgi:hypothetical protein